MRFGRRRKVLLCPPPSDFLPSAVSAIDIYSFENRRATHVPLCRYPFLLPNLFGACAALLMMPLVLFCLPETRTPNEGARNHARSVPKRFCIESALNISQRLACASVARETKYMLIHRICLSVPHSRKTSSFEGTMRQNLSGLSHARCTLSNVV